MQNLFNFIQNMTGLMGAGMGFVEILVAALAAGVVIWIGSEMLSPGTDNGNAMEFAGQLLSS